MFSSRRGKIACLPEDVRDELNFHLANGVRGPELLPWLNSLPQVRNVLTRLFGGRNINHQNLSAWRRGGFRDWMFSRKILEAHAARSAAVGQSQLQGELL